MSSAGAIFRLIPYPVQEYFKHWSYVQVNTLSCSTVCQAPEAQSYVIRLTHDPVQDLLSSRAILRLIYVKLLNSMMINTVQRTKQSYA